MGDQGCVGVEIVGCGSGAQCVVDIVCAVLCKTVEGGTE